MKPYQGVANPRSGRLGPFIVGALTFVLRMPFWSRPLNMDEGLYAYGGWRILKGLVLYRDLYDFKPPGVYFLNAALFSITSPDAVNVYLCAAIFAALTSVAVYALAKEVWGSKPAFLAGVLFAVFSPTPYIQGNGANTEVFMVLPLTWAYYVMIRSLDRSARRNYFVAGLLVGLAAMFKQTAVVGIAAGLYTIYWNRKGLRSYKTSVGPCAIFLSGFVVPSLCFLVYFAWQGAFSGFVFWQFQYPFRYVAAVGDRMAWFIVLQRVSWVMRGTLLVWVFSLVVVILAFVRYSGRKERFLTALFFISCAGVAAGSNFYVYYFVQVMPVLCVLGAGGIAITARYARERRSILLYSILAVALIAPSYIFAKNNFRFFTASPDDASKRENSWGFDEPMLFVTGKSVGQNLRKITREADRVFVWRYHPEINFYALRETPAHMPILALPNTPWDIWQIVLEDVRAKRPEYVVVIDPMPRDTFHKLFLILQTDYRKVYGIRGLPYPEQGIYIRQEERRM